MVSKNGIEITTLHYVLNVRLMTLIYFNVSMHIFLVRLHLQNTPRTAASLFMAHVVMERMNEYTR